MTKEFKIVHHCRLGRLDAYTGAKPCPHYLSLGGFVADEFRAQLCGYWCCPQPSALSPLIPLLLSPPLTRLGASLDSKPRVTSICSCSFPTRRVEQSQDEICLVGACEQQTFHECPSFYMHPMQNDFAFTRSRHAVIVIKQVLLPELNNMNTSNLLFENHTDWHSWIMYNIESCYCNFQDSSRTIFEPCYKNIIYYKVFVHPPNHYLLSLLWRPIYGRGKQRGGEGQGNHSLSEMG